MRAAYIQWDIHVNVTGGDGSSGLCCRRWRAAGLGRSAGMTPHTSLPGRFSKPIVLRDRAPLATLEEARAFLATLSPAQKTPTVYYARVMLGHALRTGKARDIEKARLELLRAFRASRGGRRTVRRAPNAVIE
jgi:hypothetical protein